MINLQIHPEVAVLWGVRAKFLDCGQYFLSYEQPDLVR